VNNQKGVWNMPFTIDDFPIEVNKPKIDVTLPEGTHVFELVVEDSAGLKSAPDRVIIIVKREEVPEPRITGITPRFGLRGETVDAVIHGEDLLDAYEVKFLRDLQEDPRVEATIQAGGTATELPIAVQIKGNAAFGERSFTVTTPGGIAQSPPDVTFSVVGMPEITDIDPLYAHQGEEEETVALITGRHLLVKSEPLSDHKVEFFYGPQLDPDVAARITENSTPEQLEVEIRVGENAMLGEHTVVVTTPAGTAQNPPDKIFDVRGPLVT
jgi:hypothetical protein